MERENKNFKKNVLTSPHPLVTNAERPFLDVSALDVRPLLFRAEVGLLFRDVFSPPSPDVLMPEPSSRQPGLLSGKLCSVEWYRQLAAIWLGGVRKWGRKREGNWKFSYMFFCLFVYEMDGEEEEEEEDKEKKNNWVAEIEEEAEGRKMDEIKIKW